MAQVLMIIGAFLLFVFQGDGLAAEAGKWPTRTIEMYVGYPPGGPADTEARILAPAMSEDLGVPGLSHRRGPRGRPLR